MPRQYYNKYSHSYNLHPWTIDDIKYFDNIKELFETNETIKEFNSVRYAINIEHMPANGWFNYDGEISTIDAEAFEFWQDLAITYELIKEHDENIERGIYTKKAIAQYEEDKSYFENSDDLQNKAKFAFNLLEYNKVIYLVKGVDEYDYKATWIFKDLTDAEAYANKIKGKLYKVNVYDLYKASLELKRLDKIMIELKRNKDNIKEINEDDLIEFNIIDAIDLI